MIRHAMPLRILIAGAHGRLGGFLSDELRSAGHHVIALGRADLDVLDEDSVARRVAAARPEAILNCTAYNAVDAAETDADRAFAVNGHAPGQLALAAESSRAIFVHFSTDFVFNGTLPRPHTESDPTDPLSVYGLTKLAGEVEIRSRTARHYILRVASLFGGTGLRGHRATLDHIADTLAAGRTVRAVTDRTVSPSYVPDVARAVRQMLEGSIPFGTYHCVTSDSTTWYVLAQFIARALGVPSRVEPIRVTDLKTIAPRPQFCALSCDKLRSVGIHMPGWQSAVMRHVQPRVASAPAPSR